MRARLVDEYTAQAPGYERSWLDLLFNRATVISVEAPNGFFNDIWIPTRKYDQTTQKLSENYTYYNVGMSTADIANLYWTEYSGNYLIGRQSDISIDFTYILTRVTAIFKKNLGKYRKLVELEGLEWNPLWNVDGVELHQILEQHADEISKDTGSGNSFKGQNLQVQHNTAAYNAGTKTEWTETHTGQDSSHKATASSTVGEIEVNSESGTIPSVSESEASASSSVNVRTHASFDYAVPVKDTAFGVALDGGDTLHTEKNVRQGNIGVTKTTELIRDARETVAYSIIQEFFNDINEVILVGIWGSRDEIPWYESYAVQPISPGSRVVNYSRTRELTFDPNGNLVNIVFTDGNVTTSYSAAEIAEEREHYGTDVVPLHETLMYP